MLRLENLTVAYPDHTTAISGLELRVAAGESVAILGANGAGKTSLLLALLGLVESSGTVELNGIPLGAKTAAEFRRQMGLVFQNPDDQLFMPLIYDDVAFGCRNLGLSEAETAARVAETLAQLNISHLAQRSCLKLSGGEKRLAAIATVLAMRPALLLFDEPTAFLDMRAKRALSAALRELPETKIIATHDLAFAATVCSRVVLLQGGQLAAVGEMSLLQNSELLESCGLESLPPKKQG